MQQKKWELPQKYWVYKKFYQLLYNTKRLFRDLLIDYQICIKCIFRIYSFQHPHIYSDPEFYLEMLVGLLENQENKDEIMKKYNVMQCGLGSTCWLCQSVYQRAYLDIVVEQIKAEIKLKGFDLFEQFKLNIRIPHVILLRNIILCRYMYHQYCKVGLNNQELTKYYNVLIMPLQTMQFIEPKTIFKWVLANHITNSTPMTSTADDHDDNLTISIDQDYTDTGAESNIMNKFRGYLGLQKKKEKIKYKKQKIDMGQHKDENIDIRCNAANIGKVIKLKQNQFEGVLGKINNLTQFWVLINGSQEAKPSIFNSITHKLALHTKNVYLCGRYIKFSRYLSQTPWIVNGQKLTQGSLQEQIQDRIVGLFYPGKKKEQIETKFHAGGREDIDVRMLRGGRPFVLQFVNPIKSIKQVSEQQILSIIPKKAYPTITDSFNKWLSQQKDSDKTQFHSWRIVKLLQLIVNHQNKFIQIDDFQQTTESFISVQLKAAETQKIKHYLCYIHSHQELTQEDKAKLDQLKDITLMQLTPLRVLHRRTLMVRDKTIHSLKFHLVSKHSAILEVWASAGTYIKEFVHGDLGRTTPNVGSLLNKEVDILQLDVGSLKEGEWAKGDEQLMQMDKFEWME